jgi:hypothetical protein
VAHGFHFLIRVSVIAYLIKYKGILKTLEMAVVELWRAPGSSLLREIIDINVNVPNGNQFIVFGDIHVEVILVLFAFKCMCPTGLYLSIGNCRS